MHQDRALIVTELCADEDELAGLTDQERRLLDLIAEGLKTIENYVSNLRAKLCMQRRTEVAAYAARLEERRHRDDRH